jgi:hypothetical protein
VDVVRAHHPVPKTAWRSLGEFFDAIAVDRRGWRTALDFLRGSLAGSAPTNSITRKLFVP